MKASIHQIPYYYKPIFARKDPLPYLEVHSHDYWEFYVMLEGESVHNINGKDYLLKPGMLSVIRPEYVHCFPRGKGLGINISIDADYLKQICGAFSTQIYTYLCQTDDLIILLDEGRAQKHSDTFDRYIKYPFDTVEHQNNMRLLFCDVFSDIMQYYCLQNETFTKYPTAVSNMLNTMSQPEKFSANIEDIIATSGYTHCHAIRLFRQYLGMTPHEYFIQSKLNYARVLLETTNMPIIDISQTVGFESTAHFASQYKKHYSVTPRDYRKNWRNWYHTYNK